MNTHIRRDLPEWQLPRYSGPSPNCVCPWGISGDRDRFSESGTLIASDEWQETLTRSRRLIANASTGKCRNVGILNCTQFVKIILIVTDPTINAFVYAEHT